MERGTGLIECLRTSDLFAGLNDEMLERIAALGQEESFRAGTVVFSEGDPAHKLYILQEGIVAIRIQPALGVKSIVVLPIEKKSGVFGWSALVKPSFYTAEAMCTTDVNLVAIDGKKLMVLLEESPSVGLVVMRRLASIISSRLRRAWAHLKEDVYLAEYRF